ncbi:hypothetical protein QQ39_07410 [Pragia fontium]|nr:hypothetical protein QQ39_07410 [Pragia fontium]
MSENRGDEEPKVRVERRETTLPAATARRARPKAESSCTTHHSEQAPKALFLCLKIVGMKNPRFESNAERQRCQRQRPEGRGQRPSHPARPTILNKRLRRFFYV